MRRLAIAGSTVLATNEQEGLLRLGSDTSRHVFPIMDSIHYDVVAKLSGVFRAILSPPTACVEPISESCNSSKRRNDSMGSLIRLDETPLDVSAPADLP